MKINRNNYELYFVDYLDGNLTDSEILMLEDFLLINPDLRAELEGTEKVTLTPDGTEFQQKEFLKKPDLSLPVSKNNFEDYCIAGSENDLNDQQRTALYEYIETHPETEKEFALFRLLHLTPDKSITFPAKGKLKKAILFIPGEILYPVLSVAAAVAFILIVYLNNEGGSTGVNGITADLPSALIARPDTGIKDPDKDNSTLQKNKPEVNQAALIAFSVPKEKKRAQQVKTVTSPRKTNDENKSKDVLPPQRLNPSFQIKLPSVADNNIYVPTIDGGKITYSKLSSKQNSPEYLTLSEYARKQLTEKVLGKKERENTRLTAFEIADAGISGINKLTGGEMKLEKRSGEDGNITAYSFNSKLLSFSTTAVK